MSDKSNPAELHDERERWKFEISQAMIDYGVAVKAHDHAAILASSTRGCDLIDQIADKIGKLEGFRSALMEWFDKTEWVQETCEGRDLGMHRADVMTRRLKESQRREAELLDLIREMDRHEGAEGWSDGVRQRIDAALAQSEPVLHGLGEDDSARFASDAGLVERGP